MEAIILAGGFGTRLSHIVKDVPKPMADIAGKPFLNCVLDYLEYYGITRVILATGYMHDKIENYYRNSYNGIQIEYSVEDEPLWTGGAIKKALSLTHEENIAVVNGDTLFKADLNELERFYLKSGADVAICGKRMYNFDRYGTLTYDNGSGRVLSFNEKRPAESGVINGGIYLINRHIFDGAEQRKFSFEKDYLERNTALKKIFVKVFDDYFIDIGVEEDYRLAQKDLS